jgi:hypothetical protein
MTIDRNNAYFTNKLEREYSGCHTTVAQNSASWTGGGGGGVVSIAKDTPVNGAITFTGTGVAQFGNNFTFNGGSGGSGNLSEVAAASGSWNSTYTTVKSNSASWVSDYTTTNNLSAGWASTRTTVNSNSANWGSGGSNVSLLSGNWQSSYTTTNVNSASWTSGYSSIKNLSAKYDSNYTTVNVNSGNWNNVWAQVNNLSAGWTLSGSVTNLGDIPSLSSNWNSVYSQVQTLSDAWMLSGSDTNLGQIPELSANWNSVYTTVNANSALWILSGTDVYLGDIPTLSGNWNSVYSQVCALSSTWGVDYISGILTPQYDLRYKSITAIDGADLGQIPYLSGNWNSTYYQMTALSGNWQSTYTIVNSNSSHWETAYAQVCSLSAGWNSTYSSTTSILLSSDYWNSTYTTVQTNSASWGGSTVAGQYEASFTTADWVGGSAPYTITTTAATHQQGATKNLSVNVKQDFGSENIIVYDSPSINDNGTVTIYTNTKYDGSIIIGKLGGINNDDVTNARKGQITCVMNGLGSVLKPNLKAYVKIENDAVIESWSAYGDGNIGYLVVDVWKCNEASFPPTIAGTIAGTNLPTIVGAKAATSIDMTTWTTQISANDYIGFNVNSCSTFTNASITLKISK